MTIDLRDITGLFYGPPDAHGVRQVNMQIRGGMTLQRTEPDIPQDRDERETGSTESQLYRAFSWMLIDHLPPCCVSVVDGPIVQEISAEEAEKYFNSEEP
jgi:hypothetical protein